MHEMRRLLGGLLGSTLCLMASCAHSPPPVQVVVCRAKETPARPPALSLPGTMFVLGRATLLDAAHEKLAEVAGLAKRSRRSLVIEGHTDSRGSFTANTELSVGRAEAVRDFLISLGVPRASIRASGFGPECALAANDTPEERAKNRRIEVYVD